MCVSLCAHSFAVAFDVRARWILMNICFQKIATFRTVIYYLCYSTPTILLFTYMQRYVFPAHFFSFLRYLSKCIFLQPLRTGIDHFHRSHFVCCRIGLTSGDVCTGLLHCLTCDCSVIFTWHWGMLGLSCC